MFGWLGTNTHFPGGFWLDVDVECWDARKNKQKPGFCPELGFASRHPGDDGVPKFFSFGKGGKVHHVSTGGLAPVWDKNYGFFMLVLTYTLHLYIIMQNNSRFYPCHLVIPPDFWSVNRCTQRWPYPGPSTVYCKFCQDAALFHHKRSQKYISFDLSWRSLTSSLESTYCFQTFLTVPGFQWSNLIDIFQLGSSTPSNAVFFECLSMRRATARRQIFGPLVWWLMLCSSTNSPMAHEFETRTRDLWEFL